MCVCVSVSPFSLLEAAETEAGSVAVKEAGSEEDLEEVAAAATAAVEECVQKKMYSSGQ